VLRSAAEELERLRVEVNDLRAQAARRMSWRCAKCGNAVGYSDPKLRQLRGALERLLELSKQQLADHDTQELRAAVADAESVLGLNGVP
jgi:hypothetical protein